MNIKHISLALLLLLSAACQTPTVPAPAYQSIIQAAIDAAVDGDTVLVQPGTYVENINFKGKSIVVASLFLTTGDTAYISQTIIDGNGSRSVVMFENREDSAAALIGFTITNGHPRGNWPENCGGGIYCDYGSSPRLEHLRVVGNISENKGGGATYNTAIRNSKHPLPSLRDRSSSDPTTAWPCESNKTISAPRRRLRSFR